MMIRETPESRDWTGTQKTASRWTVSIGFGQKVPREQQGNRPSKNVSSICSGLGASSERLWTEPAHTQGLRRARVSSAHLLSRDVVCFKRSRRRPTLTNQVQISRHRDAEVDAVFMLMATGEAQKPDCTKQTCHTAADPMTTQRSAKGTREGDFALAQK